MAFSYHSKTSCLAFVNIYKYSPSPPFFFLVTDTLSEGETRHSGTVQCPSPMEDWEDWPLCLYPGEACVSKLPVDANGGNTACVFICASIEIFSCYCQGKPNASLDL